MSYGKWRGDERLDEKWTINGSKDEIMDIPKQMRTELDRRG